MPWQAELTKNALIALLYGVTTVKCQGQIWLVVNFEMMHSQQCANVRRVLY